MKQELIAVYGTLKRGFGNNRLLTNSEFLGAEVINTDMVMKSLGGFPGLVETPGEKHDIHIEVFKLESEETKRRVDSLEGHPGWYDKKEIQTSFGPANVYYFKEGNYANNAVVEDGNWKKMY